jgi:hypothetical protein
MTVSMGIKHQDTGTYDVVPIATSEHFERHWLPACAHLGLRHVSHFHDGALSALRSEDLPEIVMDLNTLRAGAVTTDAFMVERIDGVLQALRESASEPCEYDFG